MPSQTLSLSQQQQLQMVLAPQLRQSLEMLQIPLMELRTLIQQELVQNPTIEEVALDQKQIEVEPETEAMDDSKEMDFEKEYEVLARLDEEWRDYFYQNVQNRPYTQEEAEKRQFLMDSLPQLESLQEHLLGQLRLSELETADQQIGELIIGSLNDDGYLTTPVEELAATSNCTAERLRDILDVIQDFHPTGVGARDLRECLLLQIKRLDRAESVAGLIVRDHIEKLGARRYQDIAKALKTTPEAVQEAVAFIATLDPKPGRIFSPGMASYILPEIVVQKVDGRYIVILNDDQLPHVRISQHYRSLLNNESTAADVKGYVRDRIRSGMFLIKSIHQRQKTIHRIATEIVEHQIEFLEEGVAKLKPMTMAEVARAVGVHETTVSRAVSGKYMRTPNGVFELKYFFTPGIKTADGQEVSNKTVKEMIAAMVADEDAGAPLSDQEIVARLQQKGIGIARRTVAKYRLVLRIPPSHVRKSY